MRTKFVDILGVRYTIHFATTEEDKLLKSCDGYCDKTTRKLVVSEPKEDSDIEDFGVYQRKCLRHEIIHAFLFESGLHENWKHDEWGHDETWIDWIASQFPKLRRAFRDADCLD